MAEKFNCFAHTARRCTALTELVCKKEVCPFFKTREDFDKQNLKSKLKIQAKYGK